MSDASKLLGVGSVFEYGGRKFRLRPFTLNDEAIYEAWLEEEAYKAVKRNRETLDATEYAIAIGAVADHAAAGDYDFLNLICQKSLASPSGIKKILSMTMQETFADGTTVDADDETVDKLYNDRMSETIELFKQMNSDPKAKAELRRQMKQRRRSAK